LGDGQAAACFGCKAITFAEWFLSFSAPALSPFPNMNGGAELKSESRRKKSLPFTMA
jgi:hypothetical protein